MVDVDIYSWSKAWQTLCTLKSLMLHSGKHIDKIYLTIPCGLQPPTDIEWIAQYLPNLIIHKAKKYIRLGEINMDDWDYSNTDIRHSLYAQHTFETSDKKYVYLTHTDVLYTGDVIGDMLAKIDNNAGVGLIGICWVCPLGRAGVCGHDKFGAYNPTYYDVLQVIKGTPLKRPCNIDIFQPMPMPECRLNEWACLIDREKTLQAGFPYLGINGNTETGCKWFRNMILKGNKFVNSHSVGLYKHGYWNEGHPGMHANINHMDNYNKAEQRAKEYFYEHFK